MAKEKTGFETVYTAATYSEAIRIMQHTEPDMVLLDMDLPGSKPVQLLKKIKSAYYNTDVIVLFNEVNEIKIQYCEYLGVVFIFDKYHDLKKIAPAVSSLSMNKLIHHL